MKVLIAEKLSQHRYKTPEGYLICVDSVLARTGKQTYRRNEIFTDSEDDRLIEVDRKAEEVFSPETMASFENKPICVEHPEVDVTVDNISEFAVGFVRDIHKGEYEGEPVMLGTLVITDAKTIEEIENGEHTDLSCGYDCDIEDCDSPEQKHIRGNHIALCEHGRAGIAHIVDSVNDMALSRTDAMDRCISLGKKFIEHFDKVYKNPNDSARNHWLSEMNTWWKSVKEIKLKNTNKPPLNGEYRDWFFTAGANPEDFMKAPTYMESKSYDDFVNVLLNGANMESAVKRIKFTDKLVESSSKEAFNKNIATEIKAGKNPKQAVAIAYSIQRKNDEESTYTEVTKNLEKEADKDMKWLDTVIGEKKEEIKDESNDFLNTQEHRRLIYEFMENNGNSFIISKEKNRLLKYIEKETGIKNADWHDVMYIICNHTRAKLYDDEEIIKDSLDIKDYDKTYIGRLFGPVAAKFNAILKYETSNGKGIAYFKPKSKVNSYEFAMSLENELRLRGWIATGWDNGYYRFVNDKLCFDSLSDKDYVPFPAKDKMNKLEALEWIRDIINNKSNTSEDREGVIYLTQKAYNDIKAIVKTYGITQKELEGISRYFFGPGGYNMFR